MIYNLTVQSDSQCKAFHKQHDKNIDTTVGGILETYDRVSSDPFLIADRRRYADCTLREVQRSYC